MRRTLGFGVSVLSLLLVLVAAGCNDNPSIAIPEAGVNDTGPPVDTGPGSFSDTGIGFDTLQILRVVPDHGPFTGGNVAILRGAGFTADAQVTFGTHDVQPADHTLIDSRRLQVVVPAGAVGTVDVTVRVGTNTFTLPMGYTYDALNVDPTRGSIAGGTFVNIEGSGTNFAAGDMALFGRTPCTDLTIVSATRITCRTPSMAAGTVDVSVVSGSGGATLTAVQAYTYYDTADPFSGGLGGGPANGTINVTVIGWGTGNPVVGAFVIVGEDLSTPYQGRTNAMGQISFSGPELVGQHNVHVQKHCFERTSFVAFDAQDVTAFLTPLQIPSCGMGAPPPPGRGTNGSFVEGNLVWYTDSSNAWTNIPTPHGTMTCPTQSTSDACGTMGCQWTPGSLGTGTCSTPWVRVAYVYTTQACIDLPSQLYSPHCANPDPSLGGAMPRVVEAPIMPGHVGYPYRIFVRPAGMAVYALAGLENTATHEFIPYVMGVARNVLVGPGETASGVNITMNIPLDHSLTADLGTLPAQVNNSPDRFYLQAYMDLGGEGVIVRSVNMVDFDVVRSRVAEPAFHFLAEPALEGSLSDGRFEIITGYTADFDQAPFSYTVMEGVTAVDDAVQLPNFLGVPDATAPANGQRLPSDRVMRWQETGGAPADFHVVILIGGDNNPAWLQFVRGDQFESPIPDLSTLGACTALGTLDATHCTDPNFPACRSDGQCWSTLSGMGAPEFEDIASGTLVWEVYSITIPGFDFDTLTYNYLDARYWSAYSSNLFTAQL